MGSNSEKQCREAEQIFKPTPSSDCSLKLDYMKLELLVMAGQHTAVNMSLFLALTARQTMGAVVLWKVTMWLQEKNSDWG